MRRLELMVWAFLLSLSFYPGSFGFLAWLSLVRPLQIISRMDGKGAFKAGYFFAFFFNLFSLYWVGLVTPPGMLAAVAIVALYYAAMLTVFNRVYKYNPFFGAIAAPLLWTGLEYFRTVSEFAFPWSDLGYSQSYYLYILQIVSVISVHGLSLMIVTVNVLLWQLIRKELDPARRLTALLSAIGIVALLIAFGWIQTPLIPIPGDVKVSLLQGSITPDEKWEEGNEDLSINLYDSLTQSVVEYNPALYIWPETSAPGYLSHDNKLNRQIGDIVKRSSTYHLVGSLGLKRNGDGYIHYNSCYLFTPDGRRGARHDKVKLVPFTEQVPYQDHLPFLRREFLMEYLTFIKTYDVNWWSDFRPGDSSVVFEIGDDTRFGTLICFESTFPEFSRDMIQRGADFIVAITNDTWFGHSVGIHMHSRILLTRAVENRCWMARVANSGITYIVDGYGRIWDELPLDDRTVLNGRISRLDGFSIFTQYGDIAGFASFLISLSLIIILLVIWILRKFIKPQLRR